jgi:hypothetical protein
MSTYEKRQNKFKRKRGDEDYRYSNQRKVSIGKEDEDLKDSIDGYATSKFHRNSTPNEYTVTMKALKLYSQSNFPGPVTREITGGDPDALSINVTMPMNLIVDQLGARPGAGPAEANNRKKWESDEKSLSEDWIRRRRKYLEQTGKLKGIIEQEFMTTDLREELNRVQAYRDAFNNDQGSMRAFMIVLIEQLSKILSWSEANSKDAIIKEIKQMKIADKGDAYAYFTDIENLINLLINANVEISKKQLNVAGIADVAVRDTQINHIKLMESARVDGDKELIKRIYDEFFYYALDDRGMTHYTNKSNEQQTAKGETPYSTRTTDANNNVTGGLGNMMKSMKKTLDRIKRENPTKKIYYVRDKPEFGNRLKTDATNILVNAQNEVKIDSHEGVDFENKDPTKKPCFYCRDTLVRFSACKKHDWNSCFFNEKGNATKKKTAEEKKKAVDFSKVKREYVKKNNIGRQR